ncbi:MAG: PTS sugar transporter subunit IIA [Sarcina sp.]
MCKILLVTHGDLGKSLKKTLAMFTRDIEHVDYISLTEEGIDKFKEEFTVKIKKLFEEKEEILILADLFGGTPFNTVLSEIIGKYSSVKVVSGVNLPMLIEATLMKDMKVEAIANLINESGKDSIKVFESIMKLEDDDE